MSIPILTKLDGIYLHEGKKYHVVVLEEQVIFRNLEKRTYFVETIQDFLLAIKTKTITK
jgi:hypothetical protein